MFLKPAADEEKVVYANRALSLELVIGIAAFVTITSIFYVNPLMNFITNLVGASGY